MIGTKQDLCGTPWLYIHLVPSVSKTDLSFKKSSSNLLRGGKERMTKGEQDTAENAVVELGCRQVEVALDAFLKSEVEICEQDTAENAVVELGCREVEVALDAFLKSEVEIASNEFEQNLFT
ncbi:hypothetical protein AVEN_214256-1 [Araneus ventricosus]|uniref:Uncharacterized protein n=1 Tax=Araneus ventricosus TaxID=182803 RepID=A0A4Y2UEM6_ARAVE|nr:hypothetical protein AVEN_214256-1 [Araneus ventricosus]